MPVASLIAAAAAGAGAPTALWRRFTAAHRRAYPPGEEARRFAIFADNMRAADDVAKSNPLATFGPNAFSDLTPEEFRQYRGLRGGDDPFACDPKPPGIRSEALPAPPASVDWRARGAVTSVKFQGSCQGCWAFSATGNIEGQWFLAGHNLTSLSSQELISCDPQHYGCTGGRMDWAFKSILDQWGGNIMTEAAYPYEDQQGFILPCNAAPDKKGIGATISGFVDLERNESVMMAWVAEHGPLSVAVDAGMAWMSYGKGIVTDCGGTALNHGVLIVGFGEHKGTPYWIVKNSWGATWGEDGYIRIAAGSNQCGIRSCPASAVVGPPTRYHCDQDTHTCGLAATGHSTQAKCEAACRV